MLIGNITRDPELRNTPNGQTVTSFSIATNRRWKNQVTNEFQEATEYHDIVAWGKSAEFIANFMKKGNKIYIDGRLQTRGWETPDGVKQRRTEVIVENFVPLNPKGSAGGSLDNLSDLSSVSTAEELPQNAPSSDIDQTETKATLAKKSAKNPENKAKNATSAPEDEINLEDIPF